MANIFTYLLFYQFAFLYLLTLVIGLVVYGSDFDSIAGWLYVSPLILMQVFHRRVWRSRFNLASGAVPKIIYTVGAIAGLLAYNDLHLKYWDEHSVFQAVCIAVLGVCSYLSSVIAAAHINNTINSTTRQCNKCHIFPLLLLGLLWWSAVWYPMVCVFALALVFVLAAIWSNALVEVPSDFQQKKYDGADTFARYAVFLLAIDISSIVWDYQVNTQWAIYLAISFISAAIGSYVALLKKNLDQVEQLVYAIVVLNFLFATLWPVFLLSFIHIGIAGLCLGFLLPKAVFRRLGDYDSREVDLSMGWATWFFFGLVISYGWYANLSMANWRILLTAPFLLIFLSFLYLRIKVLKNKV